MISNAVAKEFGPNIRVQEQEGVDLGNGNIKTGHGTIRVPRSERSRKTVDTPPEPAPEPSEPVRPVRQEKAIIHQVTVHTEIGAMTVLCKEVNVCDDFLVLGLVDPQTFSPKSYKDDPAVRLDVEYKDLRAAYVYTGCRWKQQLTGTTFVVLMKV